MGRGLPPTLPTARRNGRPRAGRGNAVKRPRPRPRSAAPPAAKSARTATSTSATGSSEDHAAGNDREDINVDDDATYDESRNDGSSGEHNEGGNDVGNGSREQGENGNQGDSNAGLPAPPALREPNGTSSMPAAISVTVGTSFGELNGSRGESNGVQNEASNQTSTSMVPASNLVPESSSRLQRRLSNSSARSSSGSGPSSGVHQHGHPHPHPNPHPHPHPHPPHMQTQAHAARTSSLGLSSNLAPASTMGTAVAGGSDQAGITTSVANSGIGSLVVERNGVSADPDDLSKLPMKAFLRNRPRGKPAPSGIRRRENMRKRREELKRLRDLGIDPEEAEKKLREEAERQKAEAEREAAKPRAPKATIKNGKLVLDEESIVWRPKVQEVSEVSVQDDEGHRVTSQSYSKRQGGPRWTEEETRIFYMALRQCGQDFSMIAEFFPKRTRKQISKKYKREERDRPDLVERALNPNASLPLEMTSLEPAFLREIRRLEEHFEKHGKEPASTLEEAIETAGVVEVEDDEEKEQDDGETTTGDLQDNDSNQNNGDDEEDEEDEEDDEDEDDDVDHDIDDYDE